MGKIRSFLGIFVFLFSVVFATNSFADGYVCDDLKTYTSCNVTYFMDGTTCTKCGKYSSTGENNTSTSCTCNDGYTTNGAPAGSSNTTTTTADCLAIQTTITLNGNGATTAGTGAIYGRYGTSVLFLDSARSQAMTSGSGNAITAPSRAHKVTYNANGGTVTTSSATATFTFNGYYSANSNGNGTGTQYIGTSGYPTSAGYSAGAALKANATWYAQWTGGIITVPTPTKAGCKFNGWYNASSGGTKIAEAGDTYKPTSDTTLYAQWTCLDIDVGDKTLTYNGTTTTNGTAQSCANVTVSSPSGATVTYSTTSGGTYSATAPTLTNVGSTTVYYKVALTDYTPATGSYTCTMNAKAMTVSASNKSKVYDGSALTCSVSVSVPNSGATIKYGTTSDTYDLTSAPTQTNVGSQTVYYQVTGDNFTTKTGSFNCSVTQANNPITIDGKVSATGTVTFPSGATATVSNASGGTLSVTTSDSSIATASVGSTTATSTTLTITAKAQGTATITVTSAATANYKAGSATYAITINPGTITISGGDKSKVYDGSPLTCSIAVTAPTSGATIKYGTASGTYNLTSAPTITNVADSKTIYYQVTAANYTTKTGSFTCKINKANGSASFKDGSSTVTKGSVTYPSTKSLTAVCSESPTSGITVTSGTPSVATAAISGTAITLTPVAAGTSTIALSCPETNNYNASSATYVLTVERGTCSISVSPTSGTITCPATTSTFTVSKGSCNGTLSATSNAEDVATVALSGTNGTVTWKSAGSATVTVTAAQSNQYKAATATYSVTNNKGANTLTLSASSGNMAYSTTKTFTVSENTSGGDLSVATSNSDVATASISETTVTITSKAAYGTADITVTSKETDCYNSATATYKVTVNMGTITLDNQSATTAGTTAIYQTYNTNVYLDSARKNAMTTSANGITIPTKTNYVFGGYYDSTSYGTQYIDANGKITSAGLTAGKALKANGTWYAKWTTASCSATNGTATLSEVSGNKVVCSITCNKGFSKNGGTDTTESFDVTGTVNTASVSATCSERTYTVAYDCGDGTGTPPTSNTATYNSYYTPAGGDTCTRSGYNFAGWAVSGTTDTKQAGTAFKWTYTADKTFTAKWTSESEKQINYVTDGGTINGSYTAACNVETATFTLPTNVTKPGYTFKGWYTAATGGTQVTSVVKGTCTSTLTFYAQWTTCNEVTAGACNCTSTQYPLNGTCTNCTYSCSNVTGFTLGTYDVCASQNNTQCYRACTTDDIENSAKVEGTVTKGGVYGCKVSTCATNYFPYNDRSECRSCPENAEECKTEPDAWECDEGYSKTGDGLGCKANTYTVTLNANGGRDGTPSVTATYNSLLPAITVPKLTNYKFVGYYDTADETGGNEYYDAAGKPVKVWDTADTGTLYARWSLGIFTCTAGQDADGNKCAAGSYCPGGNVSAGTEYSTTSGCKRTCPTASGKTVTSPLGSYEQTDCQAIGNVSIYSSNTSITSATGSGTETCNWNGTAYAGSCVTVPTSCLDGYWRDADNSPFCNEVGRGYYRAVTEAIRVRNECSALRGAITGVTTTEKTTSKSATQCYNTCSNIAITNGTRVPTATSVYYDGTKIPACTYTTECDKPGYEADGETCVPMVYEITLDHDGGTSSTNTIWLKYNTGWYSNEGATTKITSVTLPTKTGGVTCSGYLSSDGDVVVDESGNLTTNYKIFADKATITANWGQNASITCAAGTYYKGTGTTCTDCPAGSYCEGVETVQGIGPEKGRAECADLNGTYTAATDASGAKLTVRIDSETKSTSAAECFATNVEYSTTTATGSQTCYYKSGTYGDRCVNKTVFTCDAGYYLAKDTDTDCSVVGKGYYSGKNDKGKEPCPLNSDTNTRGTTIGTTSASEQDCIMDNLWFENDTSGQRRQCFYSSTSKKYDWNCPLSVVVTCIGGYWYDASKFDAGSTSEKYCVPVGENHYSPAQSACSGEVAQPTSPGCSTKRTACPAGSTTNGITTASSSSQCDGACPEDMVCEEGKEAVSCSDLTGGEYPKSDVGTTDVSGCYYESTMMCSAPEHHYSYALEMWATDCGDPTAYSRCIYDTSKSVACKWYYGDSECTPDVEEDELRSGQWTCPILLKDKHQVYCKSGYFRDEDLCVSCSTVGGGKYPSSTGGIWGAVAYDDYVGCVSDYGGAEFVCDNTCPENADICQLQSTTIPGVSAYRGEGVESVIVPYSSYSCKMNVVCEGGYTAQYNAEWESINCGLLGCSQYTSGSYSDEYEYIVCTPNTYTVEYHDNYMGGNVTMESQEFTFGVSQQLRKNLFERHGYTFKGWNTKEDGTGTSYSNQQSVSELTTDANGVVDLFAQWQPVVYNITYNLNGGTNSAANPATYTIEDTPLTLKNPSKKGYIFDGWTGDKVSGDKIAEGTTGNVTVTANWTETTFTVHFDPTDAAGVSVPDVTCTYDMQCKAADAIIMDYKTFSVWNTQADGSGQSIAAGGNITNLVSDGGEITLYAIWDQNMVACEAGYYFNNGTRTECKLGKYCPGTGKINEGSTGCIETCPAGGETIKSGETAITQCRKITVNGDIKFEYGTALWDCAYTSGTGDSAVYFEDCDAIALSCDAGYYYTGNGAIACTPVPDGYYSPAPEKADGAEYPETMKSHACPGETGADDGIGSVQPRAAMTNCYSACALTTSDITNSKTVTADEERMFSTTGGDYPACSYTITCNPGYTPQDGTDPKCIANKYTIVLDKNQGTGNVVDSVKCEFNSGKCDLPATSALTRAGYVPAGKWCTNADGTGTCYTAGASTDKNISAKGENTKLYAAWDADVFKIALVASDATSNATQDPVYLKYTIGWYSDEAAKTPITSIETANLPSKPGYNFAGYKIGDVTIVDASGKLQTTAAVLTVTTKDTSANVVWAQGNTDCEAGYYYPGTGGSCVVCEAKHYCPGGSFPTDAGLAGHELCPDDGISAGGESATNVGVCYKQGLDYTSTTKKASGTQTCNYNDTDKKYNYPCRDISVKSCVAGYYYVSGTDCTEVGEDHYSGEGSRTREVCPENGTTGSLTTAAEVGQCYKTVDYDATYGTGTQVCNYTSQNDDGSAKWATECRDKYITACQGGYYRENADAIDCVIVDKNSYSIDGSVNKIPCPDEGETEAPGAATSTMCYKSENPFTSEHGSGVRWCRYTPETGDYTVCGDRMFQNCSAGYYWAAYGDADCVPVDYGFFGPVADAGNEGYLTARQECATYNGQRGQTEDPTSADASACFMSDIPCEAGSGTGTKVCGYDTSAENYTADCTTCAVDSCANGYYLSNNQCIQCPEGSICDENTGKDTDGDGIPDSQPKVCADLFNGRYPNSDKGATSTDQCWGACDASGNVETMSGRDYAGENIADTCEIASCKPQYYLSSDATECILCPEGMICEPGSGEDLDGDGKPDNGPKSCKDLTNGTHPFAEPGSTKIEQCYITCEDYEIEYGMAIRDSDKAYYDNVCTYKGVSDTGNPCEIRTVNGVETCVETSCKPEYELINGRCQECDRENATAYKPNGNCLVAKCHTGYHPDGDQCADNVQTCSAPNAIAATRTWDTKIGAYGICVITECADGYHIASNACVPDVQECDVEHGSGVQEWDSRRGAWGDCIATSCDAGYTNDKYETDEPGKQCGRCRNAYSILGEVAVSSYVRGCEIAACLYQGELYNLENNECVPICPIKEYTDPEGTGTMKWNPNTKKCERKCNEGYIPW